jgi:AAA15 family ATPase/GTPase
MRFFFFCYIFFLAKCSQLPFFFFSFSKWLIICVFWGFLLAKYLQFKKTARFLYWVVACTSVFVFFFFLPFFDVKFNEKNRKITRIYTTKKFSNSKVFKKITRNVAKECEGRLNVFKKLSYPAYRQIWRNCSMDDRHFRLHHINGKKEPHCEPRQ